MSYQVLARSWRPQRFADLLGQEAIITTLQNAIASGTLGHAYLFSGLRGVGKTTVARLLAKAVNCEQGPTPEPCGTCVPCVEITAGSALDVVELDGASNRGIDDVRELKDLLRYRPSRDRFRVIIIDEVHMLTREAFNALLKSLEEPPPYILFIFATTERHKVPATILSRCQQLEFRPVPTELIASRLAEIASEESFQLEAEAAGMIARAAGGSVRDALSLTDQLRAFSGDHIDAAAVATVLGVPEQERILELIRGLVSGDAAGALDMIRQELRAGHDAAVLFEELGRTLRGLALLAVNATDPQEIRPDAVDLASLVSADGWARFLGLWLEQDRIIREAAHRELALEVAILRLSRWPSVRRVEELLSSGGTPPASESGGPGPVRRKSADTGKMAAPSEPVGGSPAESLAEILWQRGRRRVAAALRDSAVVRHGDAVVISVPAEKGALARILEEDAAAVAEATSFLWEERLEVQVKLLEPVPEDRGNGVSEAARQDPGVRQVLDILGGELGRVVPDGKSGGDRWT